MKRTVILSLFLFVSTGCAMTGSVNRKMDRVRFEPAPVVTTQSTEGRYCGPARITDSKAEYDFYRLHDPIFRRIRERDEQELSSERMVLLYPRDNRNRKAVVFTPRAGLQGTYQAEKLVQEIVSCREVAGVGASYSLDRVVYLKRQKVVEGGEDREPSSIIMDEQEYCREPVIILLAFSSQEVKNFLEQSKTQKKFPGRADDGVHAVGFVMSEPGHIKGVVRGTWSPAAGGSWKWDEEKTVVDCLAGSLPGDEGSKQKARYAYSVPVDIITAPFQLLVVIGRWIGTALAGQP